MLLFAGLVVVGACASTEITLGGELAITIVTNAPVSAGDSLRLDYDVSGGSLAGMEVLWGDTQIDSLGFQGAQTAGGSEFHVYDSAGTYTIRATAVDQIQGTDFAELTVTITP